MTVHEPIVTFYKFHRSSPDIRKAEKSGLGSIPAVAFQYCEAVRQASAFGWYVYPPQDIHLLFDGKEIFQYEDNQWYPLKSVDFSNSFVDDWEGIAPKEHKENFPPFLTEFYVPGIVQIWSGYFVQSAPGWSILVRSPSNFDVRSSISCYEGIVETDEYQPAPLFANVKCIATNRELYISKDEPLFQVQPLRRETYTNDVNQIVIRDATSGDIEGFNWSGLNRTVREVSERGNRRPGSYAVSRRKR